MPKTPSAERRIALFLDFENIVHDSRVAPAQYDLAPVLARLLEKGKLVYRRAYCDWQRFRGYTQMLHDLGIELVDVPPSTRAGKNGADMRLVIDALELCYAREHIDTFAIASGDSDFVPLVAKLRENDRYVIGLGADRQSSSQLFVRSCDEFFYIDEILGQKSRRREPRAAAKPSTEAPKGDLAPVLEMVDALYADLQRPIAPSAIKDALRRRQPDFDERALGFRSMTKLLEHLETTGEIRRVQHQKSDQLYVVPAESPIGTAPAPVTQATLPIGGIVAVDAEEAGRAEAPAAAEWSDALRAAAETPAAKKASVPLLEEEHANPDAPLPGNEKERPPAETHLGIEKRPHGGRRRRGGRGRGRGAPLT